MALENFRHEQTYEEEMLEVTPEALQMLAFGEHVDHLKLLNRVKIGLVALGSPSTETYSEESCLSNLQQELAFQVDDLSATDKLRLVNFILKVTHCDRENTFVSRGRTLWSRSYLGVLLIKKCIKLRRFDDAILLSTVHSCTPDELRQLSTKELVQLLRRGMFFEKLADVVVQRKNCPWTTLGNLALRRGYPLSSYALRKLGKMCKLTHKK